MTDPQTKRCPKCGRTLPRTAFVANKRRSGGISSACRDCERDRIRAYQATPRGRENHRRASRDWYYRHLGTSRPESAGN